MREIRFEVKGIPMGAGSKTSFPHKITKKMITMDTSGKPGKDWRQDIRAAVYPEKELIRAPMSLYAVFYFPRSKSHFGTGKNAKVLKKTAPKNYTGKDLAKLVRALEDALNGYLWKDDSQIIHHDTWKQYGDPPGVIVKLEIDD